MTLLLLCLMAYQVTGQRLHEQLGAFMILLTFVHNALNARWYGNLFKGAYTPIRALRTVVNLSALAAMVCVALSGVAMSRYVFANFETRGLVSYARLMHMAGAYWGFVLMSVHLGMHWGIFLGLSGKLLKGKEKRRAVKISLRAAALFIAAYGAYRFIKNGLFSYMFLKNQFVFFDFERSAVLVFAEYAAMTGLWAAVGYYASLFAGRFSAPQKR